MADELKLYLELPASAALLGDLCTAITIMELEGELHEEGEVAVLKIRRGPGYQRASAGPDTPYPQAESDRN